jgi:hypothetical protein
MSITLLGRSLYLILTYFLVLLPIQTTPDYIPSSTILPLILLMILLLGAIDFFIGLFSLFNNIKIQKNIKNLSLVFGIISLLMSGLYFSLWYYQIWYIGIILLATGVFIIYLSATIKPFI